MKKLLSILFIVLITSSCMTKVACVGAAKMAEIIANAIKNSRSHSTPAIPI